MNVLLNDKNEGVGGLSGTSKTMFVLGLTMGIGGMSLLALFFVMSVFLNGNSGDLLAAKATSAAVIPSAPSPTAIADAADDPYEPAYPPGDVTDTDHIRGNKNAKVTLIEYSDFECPFCLQHGDTLNQLLAAYPNDVRVVYRHFPLTGLHPEAQKAAEASECAADQGKFWEMHDAIFQANADGTMSVNAWKKIAGTLQLDTNAFSNCLDSGEKASVVATHQNDGANAGIAGTPGTFVNGQLIEGAIPFANFKQIVEAAGASS